MLLAAAPPPEIPGPKPTASMSPAADETQVQDTDSSPSPSPERVDTEDPSTAPLCDTLPIEDLIGETQVLDDPDSPEIDLWGETQVVDDYEEAGADDVSDGTDRTEEPSNNDGVKAAPFGVKSGVDGRECGGERGSDDRQAARTSGGGGIGEKDVVVDSDASTDEEGGAGDHVSSASLHSLHTGVSTQSNHGSAKKNFAAVRSASLRSSGLSAARKKALKQLDSVPSSFSNGGYNSRKEDAAAGGQTGTKGIELENLLNSPMELTSLGARACEMDLDREIENIHRCTQDYHRDESKSRINNPRVKKLFYEVTPPGREEISKADDIIEKEHSPHLLASDCAVGGLSYIDSQEPGDQSQSNALDIVDNFLLANDVGSSQEFKMGKREIVKTPPTSNIIGAQSLAKKSDHGSPVGKDGIYEWIDNLEDEGGGDFFTKKKATFFESGARKSHSQPPKVRQSRSGIARGAVHKSGEMDGVGSTINQKLASFTRSDSRLMLCRVSKKENAKTKKNLFKNVNEPLSSKSPHQQLMTNDAGGGAEGTYDVGLDTQMAAEAMEALLHGSPVNYGMEEDAPPVSRKVSENFSKVVTKKSSSKSVPPTKKTSAPDLEGITTRSKERKMFGAKSRRGSYIVPMKQTSSSKTRKSLEDLTVETRTIREKKVEGHLDATRLAGKQFSRSHKGKAEGMVDGIFTKGVNNCLGSLTLNVQLSASKELTPGENHVNSTPIAHRTRHSRVSTLMQRTEVSPNKHGKEIDSLVYKGGSDGTKRENKPVKPKRKGSDQTAPFEKEYEGHTESHEEEPKTSILVKDSFSHPKRRRTSKTSNPNIDNPSISINSGSATNGQSSTRGKRKFFIRSVSEILSSAKRKKRSASALEESKSDSRPSDSKKLPMVPGVRTRSSLNSLSKNCLEKDFMEHSSRPVLCGSGSIDTKNNNVTVVMSHSIHLKESALCNNDVDSGSCVKDADETGRDNESSKEKVKSDLPCTTPSKAIDASPVCMAQDPLRTPWNRGISRSSIVRELIRLESAETSPTWMLRDSRRRKGMTTVRVLFSHHLDEDTIKQQKKILARLGVPIASSMSDATHFVADMFVRTRNMLEAMALGKPVVTHMWLESCGQACCFIDEKNYILRDTKKEKEIGFSMPVSLARACRCPLLQGKRVFITPNAKPGMDLIASLVKAAHGQPVERIGRYAVKDDKALSELLVISCEEDYAICKPLLEKGTEVFSSELLLNGIVIQKLEYERHQLFLDHVKRTRSTIWLRREDGSQFLPVNRCA